MRKQYARRATIRTRSVKENASRALQDTFATPYRSLSAVKTTTVKLESLLQQSALPVITPYQRLLPPQVLAKSAPQDNNAAVVKTPDQVLTAHPLLMFSQSAPQASSVLPVQLNLTIRISYQIAQSDITVPLEPSRRYLVLQERLAQLQVSQHLTPIVQLDTTAVEPPRQLLQQVLLKVVENAPQDPSVIPELVHLLHASWSLTTRLLAEPIQQPV